jgi:hypothetical protein
MNHPEFLYTKVKADHRTTGQQHIQTALTLASQPTPSIIVMLAERQSRRVVFLMLALQLLSLVGLLAHSRSSVAAFFVDDAFPYPSWRRGLIHVQEQPCKVCSTPSTTATATTTTRLSLHRKLPDLFGRSDDDKKKLQSDNTRDRNDKDSSDPEESTSSSSSSGTRSKNTSSSSNNSNTRLSQNVGGVMESMGNFKNAQKVGQLTQNLVQDLSRTMSVSNRRVALAFYDIVDDGVLLFFRFVTNTMIFFVFLLDRKVPPPKGGYVSSWTVNNVPSVSRLMRVTLKSCCPPRVVVVPAARMMRRCLPKSYPVPLPQPCNEHMPNRWKVSMKR